MVAGGKREARGPRLASEVSSPGRGDKRAIGMKQYPTFAPAGALFQSIASGGCATLAPGYLLLPGA
jgi:hypothetical protein